MPALNGTVSRKRGKAKMKLELKRRLAIEKITALGSEDLDVRAALIQELIPLGLEEVRRELQDEVCRLTGARYTHGGGDNHRWGHQNGSVYMRDQKFPIVVPRLRNRSANREVPLESYEKFKQPFAGDNQTVLKLLHGLSTHRYRESAELAAEAFGISASNLSKRFKEKTADTLKELQTRSLLKHDIVVVFIDAKRYAEDGLMVALGVTLQGEKFILGSEQTHGENSRAVEQWLDGLIQRGLKFEEGILFIIDGSKGIKKAIERRLGDFALIQRCQWHKRENVVSYLNDSEKVLCRVRMSGAYSKTTYREARAELEKLHHELKNVNVSAANSLEEGLEETLTIHRLGLSAELSRSLGTTNCIESTMSQMGYYTDKVDRWHNSDQILRWTAAALMDFEPRMHRIKGYRYLPVLRFKLKEMVNKRREERAPSKEREMVEV
jgi:putative transposase